MNLPSRFVALCLFALCSASLAPVVAQPAANAIGDGRQVISPEVGVDRAVTFRLYAPNAKSVIVVGDLLPRNARLAKDDATGIWTYSNPPLPPGLYGYYFNIDGIRFSDPGNLFTHAGARFLKSYVEVEGDGTEYWAQRDVPHGQLHELWYKNPQLGTRHMIVYTPPGYDPAGARTYPVVVLFSGSGDNETYWTKIGRAHFVMDNLIADGKAKPAILVMPYGSIAVPSAPDGQEDTADGIYSVRAIERDLIDHALPLLEKQFKVGTQPKDRAIYGFSMGGYLAPTIGLNNPGVFGWVAGASASYRGEGVPRLNFKRLEAQLELAKRNFRWVGLTVGDDQASGENGHAPANKAAVDYLNGLGLNVEWSHAPGGSHTWMSWRGYFRDLMVDKFFVENPYSTPKVGTPR